MKTLAFSSCPNDTFIFHALVHSLIDINGLSFSTHIDDVESLNHAALNQQYDITKLSFHGFLHVQDNYELLDAGAALGFGCGPLVITRKGLNNIQHAVIATPGIYTTAHLLFRLCFGNSNELVHVRFDEILPGIQQGIFDAGVIIHEGRFVYQNYNCDMLIDLGKWWEDVTGLPIPLGCIAIHKKHSAQKSLIEEMIRNSLDYARRHPYDSKEYIHKLAQELDETVIQQHIDLYVNDFSVSLGHTGHNALAALREMAQCQNLL
ncbi:MAG TPA: 1,4-dihydroxy-6-naphthoate synthase [Spirochaetota bacterium]|nr:1,4-dihydroxy-6-naphthoate synthase [Spirochaetota bacterium]HPD05867.1 1,4-dihydroxy-6-naphthoate synthase [Spirochaetota bacterium]